jgi:transposase
LTPFDRTVDSIESMGAKELLSVEDWAEIRRLYRAEGLPIKTIARTLGVSRNTVRTAIASDGPPRYERKPAGSAVDAFEDAIREQLAAVLRTNMCHQQLLDLVELDVFDDRLLDPQQGSP